MDYNEFREGVTLYLPVYQPGALLLLGDGHAARDMNESPMNASNYAFYKDLEAIRTRSEKGRTELMRRTVIAAFE